MTPAGKTSKRPTGKGKEEECSPKFLVLHNDDFNTFTHVITCLVEICGHDEMQAEQCALITHLKGSCDVKKGAELLLEDMREEMQQQGLTVTIEE